MMILDSFLLNEPQLTTALYTGLFVLLSAFVGAGLRRPPVEGAVWGFLILAGSADLAIFISRTLMLPTDAFAALVAVLSLGIVFFVRLFFFPAAARRQPPDWFFRAVVAAFAAVVWAGNILHPFPDSGFSSHHGWVPLYIQESYSLGRFALIEDTAFGQGLMTTLFYPADLLGLVALAGWFGAEEAYPAFNAGSIAATLLMFALLARGLKENKVALGVFFALSMGMFAFDPFFRTTLGGNWGDVLMYLGGALVCYYLGRGGRRERAFLLAAAASTFLVFARHYGAFYSALIAAAGFLVSWFVLSERRFRPWLGVGALWLVFSVRELYYLFGRPTQFYPGTWQADRLVYSAEDLFLGALTDWGLIDGGEASFSAVSLRSIYLLVLIVALWSVRRRPGDMVPLLSPLLVLLAPLALQTVTGYRTNADYSKLYILSIFIFAWYPAHLLACAVPGARLSAIWNRGRGPVSISLVAGAAVLAAMIGHRVYSTGIVAGNMETTLHRLFEDDIADRQIAAMLRADLSPEQLQDVKARPVMYLYFEPGTSLRLYLGGRFFQDLDFWSEPVGEHVAGAETFGALLEKLDYPNVYVGLMSGGMAPDFGFPGRKKYLPEIEHPHGAPWLDRVFDHGGARFLVTRPPASGNRVD